MRKYSWNIFRWIQWVCRRIWYRNKKFINYYAPKPVRVKWINEKFGNYIEVWRKQWQKPK